MSADTTDADEPSSVTTSLLRPEDDVAPPVELRSDVAHAKRGDFLSETGRRSQCEILTDSSDSETSVAHDSTTAGRARLTCVVVLSALVSLLSSFQFGYGLGAFNSAEYFLPVFVSNTQQKNHSSDTSLLNFDHRVGAVFSYPNVLHNAVNKTCGHMHAWFKDCVPLTASFEWSIIVAVFSVGGLLGAMVGGPAAKLRCFGRVWTLWGSSFVFVIAYAFESLFSSFWALTVGRVLQGFACGVATVVVPMYLTEITPVRFRGSFGVCAQLWLTLGSFAGMAISLVTKSGQLWRVLFGWILVIPIIQIVVLPCLPASPKWLINHNRLKKARRVLQCLRGNSEVDDEFSELLGGTSTTVSSTTTDAGGDGILKTSPAQSFRMPCKKVVLHMCIAIGVLLVQQFSGINAVVLYSTQVFYKAGVDRFLPPDVATVIVALASVVAVLPAGPLVECAGRKAMLLIGLILQGLSMAIVTVSMTCTDYAPQWFGPHTKTASSFALAFGIVSVVGVVAIRASFQVGLGPISWFFASELFTTRWRPYAQAIGCAAYWVSAFVIALTFRTMMKYLTHFSFLPFIGVVIVSVILIAIFVPETKNKDIREIVGAKSTLPEHESLLNPSQESLQDDL